MTVTRTLVATVCLFVVSDSSWADAREKARAGTHEESIEHGGLRRTYRIHVPPLYDGSKPVPLVLVLHTGGGSGLITERGFGFNPLSDKEGFLVVYPEGVEHHWNDGRIGPRFAKIHEIDDVSFIRALIDHLEKSRKIDPRRIYATGLSNGGFLSHRLGWELSDSLAAIATASATLDPGQAAKFAPKNPVHVLQMHGTKDPIIPYVGGECAGDAGQCIAVPAMIALWVKANGCLLPPKVENLPDKDPNDGTSVRRETYAPGEKGAEVVLYTIDGQGQGHGWPGLRPPT